MKTSGCGRWSFLVFFVCLRSDFRVVCRTILLSSLFIVSLLTQTPLWAAEPILLSDINLSGDATPKDFVRAGGINYFTADDGIHGRELWRTDGFLDGTFMVKDIDPGDGSGDPRDLTVAGNTLFFVADDSAHGYELWKSDGTTDGTVMIKDIKEGSSSSYPAELAVMNGALYFKAADDSHGTELWTSDGTAGGTALVKDINPSGSASPGYLAVMNDMLYFAAYTPEAGTELWQSNGTAEGTQLVKDVYPGTTSSSPYNLTPSGSTLFFAANTEGVSKELFKSDGTAVGTMLVRDINPGGKGYPALLTPFTGGVAFIVNHTDYGQELWFSDGTTDGTVLLKDINPGTGGSYITAIQVFDGKLIFNATDGTHGAELWRSDGTTEGTELLKDIADGDDPSDPESFAKVGGVLYFAATDANHGKELWKTDGTPEGTTIAADIVPGTIGGDPGALADLGGTLYFFATDLTHGTEPWRYSDTIGAAVGDRVWFDANGNGLQDEDEPGMRRNTVELLDDDGETVLATTYADGDGKYAFTNLRGGDYRIRFPLPDAAYVNVVSDQGSDDAIDSDPDPFTGLTPAVTIAAGETDMTVDGGMWEPAPFEAPELLVDINPDGHADPAGWVQVSENVFFTADDGTMGRELWITDGSAEGTHMVKDIQSGATGSDPEELVSAMGVLMFSADDGVHGRELWQSDGTEAGTRLAVDIIDGETGSSPELLTPWQDRLAFMADDPGGDRRLYILKPDVSSGTEALRFIESDGSRALLDDGHTLQPVETIDGIPVRDATGITAVGAGIYFSSGSDPLVGNELYYLQSDATGCSLVDDIVSGADGSNPQQITAWGSGVALAALTWGDKPVPLWSPGIDEVNYIMFFGSGTGEVGNFTIGPKGSLYFTELGYSGGGLPPSGALWAAPQSSESMATNILFYEGTAALQSTSNWTIVSGIKQGDTNRLAFFARPSPSTVDFTELGTGAPPTASAASGDLIGLLSSGGLQMANGRTGQVESFLDLIPDAEVKSLFGYSGNSEMLFFSAGHKPYVARRKVHGPNLMLTKTVSPENPLPGGRATFTIIVKNIGDAPATNVVVTENRPQSLELQEWMLEKELALTQGNYTKGDPDKWHVGTLAPGATAALTLVTEVSGDVTPNTPINNSASVAGGETDTENSDNKSAVAFVTGTPQPTDVSVTKNVDKNPAKSEDIITYTITVTNNSNVEATHVSVTDTISSEKVDIQSTSTTQGSFETAHTVGLWEVGPLAPHTSATLTLTAKLWLVGELSNTARASVSSAQEETSTANNAASVTVTVLPSSFILNVTVELREDMAEISYDPSDSGVIFPEGQIVTVTAHPAKDAVFDHWSGPVIGDAGSPTVQVKMDTNKSITAYLKDRPVSGNGTHGTLDDPVNTATGEFYFSVPMLDLGGPLPLGFSLYYGSAVHDRSLVTDAFGNTLGLNWLHNFQMTLLGPEDGRVTLLLENGRTVVFKDEGDQWILAAAKDVPYVLKDDGAGNFYLLDPSEQRVYVFGDSGRLDSIEDRNGNTLGLTYDESGLLTSVADGLGRTLALGYDEADRLSTVSDGQDRTCTIGYTDDRLTSIQDPLGHTTTYAYAETGTALITSVTLPEGNSHYVQTYDEESRVSAQDDASGNRTTLAYEADEEGGTVTTITYPDTTSAKHIHNKLGLLTDYMDPAGKTATVTYDAAGRRTGVTDRMGATSTLSYHETTGTVSSVTNAEGVTMGSVYTARAQQIGPMTFTFYDVTRINLPDGTHEEYTYDGSGNMLTRTDGAGKVYTQTYNSRGLLLSVTNPAGGRLDYIYNEDGTLASATDSDTGVTTYAYDGYRRLKGITRPDGAATTLALDANNRLTGVTDADSNTTTYQYDDNGNLSDMENPDGEHSLFTYDAMDRLLTAADFSGGVTTYARDTMGRLSRITNPNNLETTFGYNALGLLTGVTRGGATWTNGYDAEAVPQTMTTPLEHAFTYTTDILGRVSEITDPLGNKTGIARDSMARLTGITDPTGRAGTYTYDTRGMLASAGITGPGQAVYTRDDLGHPVKIKDLNGAEWTFTYTTMGRPATATDPLGHQYQYGFDTSGRLATVTFPDNEVRTLTYDDRDNLTDLDYSTGLHIDYGYDKQNRLITTDELALTRDAVGRVTESRDGDAVFAATCDAGGRLATVTYDNLFTVTYTYDADTGLPASVSDDLTGTTMGFTYDADRRLTGISRPNGVDTAITYDAAGRVTGLADGTIIDIDATLDGAGRVTRAVMQVPLDPADLLESGRQTAAFDAASMITDDGFTYDERGHMTAAPGHTFTWDAAGRLAGLDATDIAYNGLGQPIFVDSGGNATHYYYNHSLAGAPLVAEKVETDTGYKRFYVRTPGGSLLYMIDSAAGNTVHFYHFDQQGSTLALTDSEGKIADTYAYTPYGRLLGHTGESDQPFLFVGRYGVQSFGDNLYRMGARFYDARTGRFLSREPLWPQLHDPRLLNPYQYALDDPERFGDTNGLEGVVLSDQWRWDGDKSIWTEKDPDANQASPEEAAKSRSIASLQFFTGSFPLGEREMILKLLGGKTFSPKERKVDNENFRSETGRAAIHHGDVGTHYDFTNFTLPPILLPKYHLTPNQLRARIKRLKAIQKWAGINWTVW